MLLLLLLTAFSHLWHEPPSQPALVHDLLDERLQAIDPVTAEADALNTKDTIKNEVNYTLMWSGIRMNTAPLCCMLLCQDK
jgi:hypothetical protein